MVARGMEPNVIHHLQYSDHRLGAAWALFEALEGNMGSEEADALFGVLEVMEQVQSARGVMYWCAQAVSFVVQE